MQKKFKFTLVEILVATGIIAVLAGIGFAGYSYAVSSGREKGTRMIIQQVATALDTCQNKLGFYPVCTAYDKITLTFENDIPSEISFGSTKFKKDDASPAKKKFFNLIIKTLDVQMFLINGVAETDNSDSKIKRFVLRDHWGNEIYYKYPKGINGNKYDLISAGVDGKFGSDNADTPVDGKGKYLDGKDWVCDDVANF